MNQEEYSKREIENAREVIRGFNRSKKVVIEEEYEDELEADRDQPGANLLLLIIIPVVIYKIFTGTF